MKSVIDETGRIQLPEEVRLQLGVKPGDQVILEPRAGEWVLRSAQASTGLAWEGNVLVHRGTSPPGAATDASLDEVRDELFRQLTKGFSHESAG